LSPERESKPCLHGQISHQEHHGMLHEGHFSTDTLHRDDFVAPPYVVGQKEMSSIEKVQAWVKPADPHASISYHHSDYHNADLIFPTLDASMQGTDSCDTIKNATRFNRSASESTVKLMSTANRITDAHQSFLSDVVDPEGSPEYSLGIDLEGISDQRDVASTSEGEELDEWDLGRIELSLEVGRDQTGERGIGCRAGPAQGRGLSRYSEGGDASAMAANRQPLESSDIDLHGVASIRLEKERDQAIGQYWMDKVGKRAIHQPEARAWADAIIFNSRSQEILLKRRRYDRLKSM
jgi:hypothetical protein